MGWTRGNNPLAKSIDSGARWTEVNAGKANDPPPQCHKPWLLSQMTLHTHARRTFFTSVCKLKLTPSNYYYYYYYYYYYVANRAV